MFETMTTPTLLRGKTNSGLGGRARKLKKQHHRKKSASLSGAEDVSTQTKNDTLYAIPACGSMKNLSDSQSSKERAPLQLEVEDAYVLSVSPTMDSSPETLDMASVLQTPEYTLNAPLVPPKS